MDIRRLFGTNLRRYRRAAGLSQEAVAEMVGVDRAHVSSMERGRQNVTLVTLARLCEALDLRPIALFDETALPAEAAHAPAGTPRERRQRPR